MAKGNREYYGIDNGRGGFVFASTREEMERWVDHRNDERWDRGPLIGMERWVDHRNDECGDNWRGRVSRAQIKRVEPDFDHPRFLDFNEPATAEVESRGGAR